MKIVNLIQRYPPAIGGSETWCQNVAQYQAKRGVITEVVTTDAFFEDKFHRYIHDAEEMTKFGPFDEDKGVFVYRYPAWSFSFRTFGARLLNKLLIKYHLRKTKMGEVVLNSPHSFEMYRNLARHFKEADVVHLHTVPYFHNLVGFWIAKFLRKPIVISPHFHPEHPHYEKKFFYRLMNRCDAVIAVSEYERDYLIKKGIKPDRIHVIGNSISAKDSVNKKAYQEFCEEINTEYGITPESKKIIFVGRKSFYKGIDQLVSAAEKLAKETDEKIFVFLVGPDDKSIMNQFAKLRKEDNLTIINFGSVSNEVKNFLLKYADVLVLPSRFEAFGIVFLEAWKYRKPVIGSDCGAIPSVVKEGGLIAPFGNIENLKNKMKTVLWDKKLAKKLGEAGYQDFKSNYTQDQVGKQVLEVYRKVKKKKRILMVNHMFPPNGLGGADIVAYKQSLAFQKMGYEVFVFTGMKNPKQELYQVERKKRKFPITFVNLNHLDYDSTYAKIGKKELEKIFFQELNRISPDAVFFHNIAGFSIDFIEQCKRLNIPTLLMAHDYWPVCFQNTFIDVHRQLCDRSGAECKNCSSVLRVGEEETIPVEKRYEIFKERMNQVDVLISPSQHLAEKFRVRGFTGKSLKVIRNGITFPQSKPPKKRKSKVIRLGYHSQIIFHKGLEKLVHAISLLGPDEREQIQVRITNGFKDDDYGDHCERMIKELGVEKQVCFEKGVPNEKIREEYKNIDLLIVPSIWPENAPLTILEALANGTPVIAGDIGGIPELVDHGKTGLLYPHDSPKALSQCIQQILNDAEKLEEMQEACLEKAKELTFEKHIETVAKTIEQLLTQPQEESSRKLKKNFALVEN